MPMPYTLNHLLGTLETTNQIKLKCLDDLSIQQLEVLLLLSQMNITTLRQLSDRINRPATDVSRTVKTLERRSMVHYTRASTDRRVKLVKLGLAGRDMLNTLKARGLTQ